MIRIVPKPTDTPNDNSTGQVTAVLEALGGHYSVLDLASIDPFENPIEGDLIWVCGIKQDMAQFELLNILAQHNLVINSPDAIATCASKARTSALLIKHGVETPDTIFTCSYDHASSFLAKHKLAVYKPLYGFDGNGIFPFTRMDELQGHGPPYYLQEFVENDHDYRVFVLDGKAIGAIKRSSDSFAHNIHQGGEGRAVEVTPRMNEVAAAAAEAIGIDYCGVDLLTRGDSYTVLEVNGTPNWHCMGVPIPRFLAEYLIRREKDYIHR
jgi:tetrahydromethanopterin:alpha-L-glutamate ligase